MSLPTLLVFLVLCSWAVQAGQSCFHSHSCFLQLFTTLWVASSAQEPGNPCWLTVLFEAWVWFLTETRFYKTPLDIYLGLVLYQWDWKPFFLTSIFYLHEVIPPEFKPELFSHLWKTPLGLREGSSPEEWDLATFECDKGTALCMYFLLKTLLALLHLSWLCFVAFIGILS